MNYLEKAQGCLLGGAVGDALGYQVEFLSYHAIIARYGEKGVTDLPNPALISDDTQMTLFTAEGLLSKEAAADPVASLYHAYLRWLKTQSGKTYDFVSYKGGLMKTAALFHTRAPGTTCLSALSSGKCGRIDDPLNDSKGCGGVMRAAPCAFFEDAFRLGCDAAAITHSHPSGYLSAGALALILRELYLGSTLEGAIHKALETLKTYPGHEETRDAINRAAALAKAGAPDAIKVESLGGGWVGEEALSIALYGALSYPDDFASALLLCVNHSGDSDSTGAICGNILGMMLGLDAIPKKWRENVELGELILEYSRELASSTTSILQSY